MKSEKDIFGISSISAIKACTILIMVKNFNAV